MYVALVPEVVGLILTPAAVAGCVLLLQMQRPYTLAIVMFAALGDRARLLLDNSKRWMIDHNRALSLAVIYTFGVLFTGRGIGALA